MMFNPGLNPGVKLLTPFFFVFWDSSVLPATFNAAPEHHCEVDFNVSIWQTRDWKPQNL